MTRRQRLRARAGGRGASHLQQFLAKLLRMDTMCKVLELVLHQSGG